MPDSQNELTILPCDDAGQLLTLYQQLLEDEQADMHKTEAQCLEDMTTFLAKGEKAFLFMAEGEPVGYALVAQDVVGYAMTNTNRKPPYLHHFCIARSARRMGYGRKAFHLLLQTLDVSEMDLEVFVWNERGIAFWRSLGFEPRTYMMRLKNTPST
jgi:ribosomal protein S18 acetylase RimI-like enzyme